MKPYVWILVVMLVCGSLTSCEDVPTEMDPNFSGTFDITYTARKVMQYDPVNINGINVAPYFDFFDTMRFTIHVVDNVMTTLSFTNADIPFSPFSFDVPQGEVECLFDTSVLPNRLVIKNTGDVIAYFRNGEFYIPFQLDCEELSYEYTFREISE